MAQFAMPHTYSSLFAHIVFATKEREALIDAALESRLYPYFGGILREERGTLCTVGGVEDHVHLLVEVPPTIAYADVIGKVKGSSTRWIHESFSGRSRFAWQRGYGIFSVSKSNVAKVAAYIEQQKEHHRRSSLCDELLEILRRHGIVVDERYLWT